MIQIGGTGQLTADAEWFETYTNNAKTNAPVWLQCEQFVLARSVPKPGKYAKVPVVHARKALDSSAVRNASVTSPRDWGTFDATLADLRLANAPDVPAMGLVLRQEGGLCTIDLDSCCEWLPDGSWQWVDDQAKRYYEAAKQASLYTERSISGCGEPIPGRRWGIHIICAGTRPEGSERCRKGKTEIYFQERFILLTFTPVEGRRTGLGSVPPQGQRVVEEVLKDIEKKKPNNAVEVLPKGMVLERGGPVMSFGVDDAWDVQSAARLVCQAEPRLEQAARNIGGPEQWTPSDYDCRIGRYLLDGEMTYGQTAALLLYFRKLYGRDLKRKDYYERTVRFLVENDIRGDDDQLTLHAERKAVKALRAEERQAVAQYASDHGIAYHQAQKHLNNQDVREAEGLTATDKWDVVAEKRKAAERAEKMLAKARKAVLKPKKEEKTTTAFHLIAAAQDPAQWPDLVGVELRALWKESQHEPFVFAEVEGEDGAIHDIPIGNLEKCIQPRAWRMALGPYLLAPKLIARKPAEWETIFWHMFAHAKLRPSRGQLSMGEDLLAMLRSLVHIATLHNVDADDAEERKAARLSLLTHEPATMGDHILVTPSLLKRELKIAHRDPTLLAAIKDLGGAQREITARPTLGTEVPVPVFSFPLSSLSKARNGADHPAQSNPNQAHDSPSVPHPGTVPSHH